MFRLVKFFVSLLLLAGLVLAGLTVKLGDKTLFGHFQAIWHSKESQDLVKGTGEAAKPILDRVRAKTGGEIAVAPPSHGDAGAADAGHPAESINAGERAKLRRIIGAAGKAGEAAGGPSHRR